MLHSILVAAHVIGGSIGILSGFTAIMVKKGSIIHNKAGIVFYFSMLFMAVSATYLAFLEPFPTNRIVGLLTIYLVYTARRAAKNKSGTTSRWDIIAMSYAVFVTILGIYYSIGIVNSRAASGTEINALEYFLFFYTGIAGLGSILDMSVIIRKGVIGSKRVVRHLWRMCFALWIAVGSFFLGQPQVFPKVLQDAPMVRAMPFLLVTILLIFWVIRVWFVKRFRVVR